jgi:hypothetical protein
MFEHVAAQRIVRVYEEARPFEQRREPRSGGEPGRAFFDYFLYTSKESDRHAGPLPAVLFFVSAAFRW